MAWWRHDTAGIRHTLSATLTEAKGWTKDVASIKGDLAGAAAATGPSGLITAALLEFSDSQTTTMAGISAKVVSGINGAQHATGVYLKTDSDQGDNTKRSDKRSGGGGHPR